MGHPPTPDEADRLFEGRARVDDPSIGPLTGFVSDLRTTFAVTPDKATRAAHLAAMAKVSPEGASVAMGRPRRRWGRASVAALGLVLAGSSAMAATGSLPGPVQDAVANGVEAVTGADLPGGSNENSAAGGQPTNERAAANKARATAFTDAKKAWNDCVHAAEQAADPEGEPVDREAVCGPKPHPSDFGTPDKTPKPEKTAKPERTEKPERTDNPNKPADPGAGAAADKTPKPERTAKPASAGPAAADKTPKPEKTPKA